jgi:hypothetical protein
MQRARRGFPNVENPRSALKVAAESLSTDAAGPTRANTEPTENAAPARRAALADGGRALRPDPRLGLHFARAALRPGRIARADPRGTPS